METHGGFSSLIVNTNSLVQADQFNKDPEKVKKFRDEKKANYRKALTINPDAMFELKKVR